MKESTLAALIRMVAVFIVVSIPLMAAFYFAGGGASDDRCMADPNEIVFAIENNMTADEYCEMKK